MIKAHLDKSTPPGVDSLYAEGRAGREKGRMPKEERRVSVLVLQIRFAELSPETAERYMFANRNMRDFYAPAPFLFKPQRSHCRAFFCFYPFPLPP